MADIFLSYAREDRAAAERVARALTERGYDVWWDSDIPAGPSYTQVIEQALTSAKCVVVLWSASSVASNWVQDESREGHERGVLVAARLADVKPPLGFRGQQVADLSAWDGNVDDREFRRLLRGIEAHLPPPKQPAPEPSPFPPLLPVSNPRQAPVSAEAVVPVRAVVPREASTPREVAAPARPLERGTPPVQSTDSRLPNSDGQEESPSPDEAAPGVIAAFFGRLNRPAIAAVVAVVVLSGMLLLLRDQGADPASSGAVTSSSSTPLAAPPDRGSRPSAARETDRTGAAPSRPEEAAAGPARSTAPPPAPAVPAPAKASATPRFRADAWQLPDEPLIGFIEVPAGQFTMGSDKGQDNKAQDNEMPQHQVSLRAFFIGRYKVTVAQYKACVDDGGCRSSDRRALEGDEGLPVTSASWYEALAYCTWLEAKLKAWAGTPGPIADALAGRRDGVGWRITLPSEAEWERAARGTDARVYPWGTGLTRSRGPSAVGAMGMVGDVSEWTRSIFRRYPYAPDDGRERLDEPGSPQFRVLRSRSYGGADLRAASRDQAMPHASGIGFRVVSSRLRP